VSPSRSESLGSFLGSFAFGGRDETGAGDWLVLLSPEAVLGRHAGTGLELNEFGAVGVAV